MNKKRGLGKGLSDIGLNELLSEVATKVALTPQTDTPESAVAVAPAATTTVAATPSPVTDKLQLLPIDIIHTGRYQPRSSFDEQGLAELADSIKTQGVIQPIIVRKQLNGYEIIAGERRWRAAQLVGLDKIPAIVRDLSDEAALAVALIENIQRRDLNAIEEASALQRLIDEFQLTHQEVATAVGKSRANVTNLLRLLKLNPDVRELVEQGQLEMGHARALLALDGAEQSHYAKQAAQKGMSVREMERLIQAIKNQSTKTSGKSISDPNIAGLQRDLADKLGAKVVIQHTRKGKGKLLIHYNSVDELDGILEHIK